MEDIFHLIRNGSAVSLRAWLNTNENDFNVCDDHGFSLLHWACWDGRNNIVEMLINRGVKLNSMNKCEDSPLHCAAQNNHIEVACLLISHKADINASNIHGNTPLHYACHFGFSDLCFELIKLGASVNNCNRYNLTPTDLCRKSLRELLLNLARSYNLPTNRISFKEDSQWRLSRNKSKDMTISCQTGINIDELPVERMLESNHGGTTWKGFWQSSEVVIKVLKVNETTPKTTSSFNQECKRLRIFNAANVLPLLGSCISLPDLIIVGQYMPYGSLFSLLHEQLHIDIDFNQAIQFAVHIAKGMQFLHNLDPLIINLDLNSKHILIDEDFTAKINMSDYSFSFLDKRKIFNPAWKAPEALKKRADDINKKSADMWSFGVILWELCTRKVPFGHLTPIQCGMKVINENMRLELPADMSSQIQKLIRICMNEDPLKRPKFEMILPILEKIKK